MPQTSGADSRRLMGHARGTAGDVLTERGGGRTSCQCRSSSALLGLPAPLVAALREGLSETGFVEGQNLAMEYRWAEFRYDRLPALAADFVAHKVEVIATNGDPRAALVAKNHLDDPNCLQRHQRPGCVWAGRQSRSAGRQPSLASAPCKPS
jgi:hypothetical protein